MAISKVASDQNKIDNFKHDLMRFDGKNRERETEMEHKFTMIQ